MKTNIFPGDIDTTGERALWEAVIMQAAIDAISDPSELNDRIMRAKTIAWFSLQNEDFMLVCSLANTDPESLIKKVKKAVQESKKIHKKKKAKQRRMKRLAAAQNKEPKKNDIIQNL